MNKTRVSSDSNLAPNPTYIRTNIMEQENQANCKFCGCRFKKRRRWDKFCSDKHRIAYHNFFKKEKKLMKELNKESNNE